MRAMMGTVRDIICHREGRAGFAGAGRSQAMNP